MKILVPTDFNRASLSAYNYASLVAERFDAEITLLHVIAGSFNTGDTLAIEPLQTLETTANERLQYFSKKYAEEQKVELPVPAKKTIVRWGMPGFTIVDYADDNDYDLIVMGSRDKYGFFDRLLGSASAITVRRSSCPVMIIHADTPMRLPEKVVFTFDDKVDIEDSVEDYRSLNKVLKAYTKFLHVDNHQGKDDISDQVAEILDEMADEEYSFAFDVQTIKGDSVTDKIKDFCLFEKADMIVMHHREKGVFGSLFGRQLSVEVAQDFKLPVLVV